MKIVIVIVAFILVAIVVIYMLGKFKSSEGFCNKSEVEVFDMLSLSYKCIPSNKILSLPKCRPTQVMMMANPSDQIHCGTIKGDPRYSKDCTTNTQYELDYTLTCPEPPDSPPVTKIDIPPSIPPPPKITDTTTCPPVPLPGIPETPKYDKSKIGSNITDKTTLGMGIPPHPTFGPRYQTIVSNLIIQSKPSPCDSSSIQNNKKTPSNIKYDEASSSSIGSGSKSSVKYDHNIKDTDIYGGHSKYTPGSAEYTMTPTIYKFSENVSDKQEEQKGHDKGSTWSLLLDAILGKESGSSGGGSGNVTNSASSNAPKDSSSNISSSSTIKSHVYENIPFPYMPKFKI